MSTTRRAVLWAVPVVVVVTSAPAYATSTDPPPVPPVGRGGLGQAAWLGWAGHSVRM